MRQRLRLPRHPGTSFAPGPDVLLAGVLATIGMLEAIVVLGGERPLAPAVVLALAVPLVWRRGRPAAVAVLVTAALAAQLVWPPVRLFDHTFVGFVALLVAAYSLGRHGAWPALVPVLVGCAVATGLTIGLNDASLASGVLGAVLMLAPAAVGHNVQGRVRLRALLEEQAEDLDAAAHVAARASAVDVRARIAGEVQDLVSQRVAAMVVQSQVAQGLTGTDTARAVEAMANVESNGREALHEMRSVLGVLRRDDEDLALAPAPRRRALLLEDGAPVPRASLRLGVGVPSPADAPRQAAAGTVDPQTKRRRLLGDHVRRGDHWLSAAVIAVTAVESATLAARSGASRPAAIAAASLAAALVAAPLVMRRGYPLGASVVGWSAAAVAAWFFPLPFFALALVVPVLAYAAGAYAENRAASRAALTVGLGGVVSVNLLAEAAQWGDYVFPAMLVGLAWFAGRSVSEQTSLTRESIERAQHLEQMREARSAAAAAEERLRIARELHDVVAHTLMVMVVQAGAARRTLESGRDGALGAMTVVTDTGRSAMTELRRLLALVDPASQARALESGLGQIPALVERTRATGLLVHLSVDGLPQTLPGGLDLAAYRIVQESLTNVLRHAHASAARVRIDYQPDHLLLEVSDDGRASTGGTSATAGNGIVGMRERVMIHGGEFHAAPQAGGGFRVSASVPFSPVTQAGTG